MYGQDAHSIRGKTTWSAPRSTVSDYLPVPRAIRELHGTVDLAVDIFFINGKDQPMLITLSRKVRLVMGQPLPNRRKSTLYEALNFIINFYRSQQFRVRKIHGDPEFKHVKGNVSADVETVGRSEHVADIEREIRTTKEKMRAIRSSVPYKKMPRIMHGGMYRFVLLWRNAFPAKNGISRVFSPRQIVSGNGCPRVCVSV